MTDLESAQSLSVQEQFAPRNACFGCGPANRLGLQLRSFVVPPTAAGARAAAPHEPREPDADADAAWRSLELTAHFQPQPHHLAFPGVVNGGIIGALLDCHGNWTAALALMSAERASAPPCTVTADFHVALRRPTPLDAILQLRAWPLSLQGHRATVEATLSAHGEVTATCRGTFVSVREGHPAFHRW